MSDATPQKGSPAKKRYIFLFSIILLVAAGWSGAWYFGRSALMEQIDAQLGQMARSGVDIGCSEMKIEGYPFRYEVRCRNFYSQDQSSASSEVDGLNAIALIYNPWHILLEAKSPAAVTVPALGLAGEAGWETARASVKYSQAGLGQFDAVIDEPRFVYQNGFLEGDALSEKIEIHTRPAPDQTDGLDVFVSLNALKTSTFPEGLDPLDIKLQVRMENGDELLQGVPLAYLIQQNGGELPLELALLEVASGASRLGAKGPLVIDSNGSLSGNLALTLSEADKALAALKPLFSGQENKFAVAEGLLRSLKPNGSDHTGSPAIELPLMIDKGIVRIGFVTLGRIPPLFQAGI